MPSLDSLLAAYRCDPTQQDALLAAATRFARRVAASLGAEEPDDVAQLVAVDLWKHSSKIDGSVTAWLRTVTKRLVYRDYARSQRRIVTAAMPDEEEGLAVPAEDDRPCRNLLGVTDPQIRVAAASLILGHNITTCAQHAGLTTAALRWRIGHAAPAGV